MKRKSYLITRCLLFCTLGLSIGSVFGGEKFTMREIGSIEVAMNHTRHEMTLYFLPLKENTDVEYRVSASVSIKRGGGSETVRKDMMEEQHRGTGRRVFKINDKSINPYQDYDIDVFVAKDGGASATSYRFYLEERFYSHVGLKEMILQGNPAQYKKILAKKPELLSYRDENGDTILHWSCKENAAANASLIDLGAELNAQNKNGETPLHKLVQTKGYYSVKQMIKWGADPTIKDNHDMTVMDYAQQEDDKNLIKILSNQ